jgi:hypothetical protein
MTQDPSLKYSSLRAERRRQMVVAIAIEDNAEDVSFVIDPSIYRK